MISTQLLAKLNAPFAQVWYRLRPGARILMYHRVTDTALMSAKSSQPDQLSISPALFAEQIKWLSEHRTIVSLQQLLTAAADNQASAAKHPGANPRLGNTVALTFDDGYLDNLINALPVLEKYNAAATVYVTSSFAAQQRRHPRYQSEPGRLHLDWNEICELAQHPLIEIGSHTVTHPMLSELDNVSAKQEIHTSKTDIEQRINQPVISFCYPSGNFTAAELAHVRKSGYDNAVSVKPGVNRHGGNRFVLKRTEITYKDTPENLKLKLEGAYDLFHKLLDRRRERQFQRRRSCNKLVGSSASNDAR